MHEVVAAIASCGVSPVVRIAANKAWMVKGMAEAPENVRRSYPTPTAHHLSPIPIRPAPYPKPIPSPLTLQIAHAHTPN